MTTQNGIIGFIQKEHDLHAPQNIVIKQGYVISGSIKNAPYKSVKPIEGQNTQISYITKDSQEKISRTTDQVVATAKANMYAIVAETRDGISGLLNETNQVAQSLGKDLIYNQIVYMAENMYAKLEDAIKALATEVYKETRTQTNAAFNDSLNNIPIPDISLHRDERFGLIFNSLEKAKKKMLGSINEAFYPSATEEKTQKFWWLLALLAIGGLTLILRGCEAADDKCDESADTAAALAEIQAKIDSFRTIGVEKYEIIASGSDNMCDTCASMDGKVYLLEEYEESVTAPPFHNHCSCTIWEFVEDEEETIPEPGHNVFSESAKEILKEIELPSWYSAWNYDHTGAYPYYVGDGGITFGYGHHISIAAVEQGASEALALLEKYNIPTNAIYSDNVGVVPDSILLTLEDMQELLDEDIKNISEKINSDFGSMGVSFSENQFDAIIIFRYLAGNLEQPLFNLLCSEDFSRKDLYDAMLNRLIKYAGNNSKFIEGWKERLEIICDLYFKDDEQ